MENDDLLQAQLDRIEAKLDKLLNIMSAEAEQKRASTRDYISDERLSRKADQLLAEARARKAAKKAARIQKNAMPDLKE